MALKSFGLYSELVIMDEMCFGDNGESYHHVVSSP